MLQLADLTAFAVARRPLALDVKAQALLTEEARARLGRLRDALEAHGGAWAPAELEAAIRAFAGAEGVGLGKFGAPLRAALGGGAPVPDLASGLAALGRDEALGRLADALSAGS